MAIKSKQDEADDLEFDVVRLGWLRQALNDVIDFHQKIARDYPFLSEAAAQEAYKSVTKVHDKIKELEGRVALLREQP